MPEVDPWYLKHLKKLRGYAWSMKKSFNCDWDVDDILNDAVVRIIEAQNKGLGPSSPGKEYGYASTIVHNLIVNQVKKNRPASSPTALSAEARTLSPVQKARLREYLEKTNYIMERLGEQNRELLVKFCLGKPLNKADRFDVTYCVVPVFAELCEEAGIPIKSRKDARGLVKRCEMDLRRQEQNE
jgi:DNA-directed RNA polymerase specialized sigma24 family protein